MGDTTKESKIRVDSELNYKVIFLIIGLTILHHVGSLVEWDVRGLDPFDIIDPLTMGIMALAAFFVSKRYWGSEVFGTSYLALAIGASLLTAGDVIYIYYENIGEDPYPSIADVFYYGFYPFSLAHVIMNTRYFHRGYNFWQKIWLVSVSAVIVILYMAIAYNEWGDYEELPFDLFYGTIFVAGAAVLLAFAVVGAAVFRHSILGKVWLLLAIGIFIQSIADVWYYFDEIFEAYDITHPTNLLWNFAFMIIIYALYKHRKVI